MKTEQSKNLYKVMQRFADLTKTLILLGNIKRAERCLRIANALLTSGNIIIVNAVANVYVYSLSSLLDHRDENCLKIMDLLPLALRKEYEHQVTSSGV
jgi:hypothetical protein